MGKKQHQSDKLYLTATEWANFFGGKKVKRELTADEKDYRRLPLDHCSLSLQPFTNPYSDMDGHIFDLASIVPFLKKYKLNPITGKRLEAKDLLKLHFTKNSDGHYHCPVLYKVFNNHSYVAAIKTTGNVFSYEAIEELNIKTKNWKDLISDEPFSRSDVIIIQDPKNFEKFNLANYYHIKHKVKVDDDDLVRAKKDPKARIKNINAETRDALQELEDTYVEPIRDIKKEPKADKVNSAYYSTGKVAASFTSTAMERETVSEPAILEDDIVRYSRIKKNGYVRLITNLGNINLELNCTHIPKACENFIKLCQKGYYNQTKFHRSIKHFMIQGGDPTGTGTGGESYWGDTFKDDMANSGENTNKSQFFITFRSCKHLDKKHTIFGKVVGGMDTLSAFEKIETDNKDKPIEDIIIQRATVFVDPYTEIDEALAAERAEESMKNSKKEEKLKKLKAPLKAYSSGVGKFINPYLQKEAKKANSGGPPSKKSKNANYSFSNFSSW
ncbi:PPIL2 [Lepeophtheirus salmonis]|uniref:RING-type E3 ubiquitin-protein ligase PPIL2 n=1 Tax=Lepeophtheirus salmonis TaxID=72036 RepID=A0A7R8CQY7_LEPSM|nr:PPIL2 [Lepeophtheirus salmonis]CAF2897759.1 PPIL2 [Lepeophtheirus salmonis]